MKKDLPTQQRLRDLFDYEENTGRFRWLKKPPGPHRGGVAGSRTGGGYYLITVDGGRYYSHRLAWVWVYGYDPESDIDHINGNTGDNRISNLRLCTASENARNGRKRKTNTSGVIGVWFHGRTKKWEAEIMVHYKKINLGAYENFSDAVSARRDAEIKYHGRFSVNAA